MLPVTGAIADRVRGLIPITWDALQKDKRVGDSTLQGSIDVAKANVTGTVVPSGQENGYPVIVVDFIAKCAVIEIVPAGVDFWMNQSLMVSSTGTNEVISYVDRASQLEELKREYLEETRTKGVEIAKLIGFYADNGRAVPQMSSAAINPYHLTPSPEEFPRPYRQTQYS